MTDPEHPLGDDDEDPFDDPQWKAFADDVKTELVPKLKSSALSIALYSGGDPDPKQAIELGYMVLLDKPIIIAVLPGSVVPNNLMKVADEIVEVDFDDVVKTGERIKAATIRVAKARGLSE